MMLEHPKMIASPPLLLPPFGVVSNFENPETRAQLQIQVTSAALAISMFFYANRFYVKHWLLMQWTWDDGTSKLHSRLCNWLTECAVTLFLAVVSYPMRTGMRKRQALTQL
jgi:hypothetical protein